MIKTCRRQQCGARKCWGRPRDAGGLRLGTTLESTHLEFHPAASPWQGTTRYRSSERRDRAGDSMATSKSPSNAMGLGPSEVPRSRGPGPWGYFFTPSRPVTSSLCGHIAAVPRLTSPRSTCRASHRSHISSSSSSSPLVYCCSPVLIAKRRPPPLISQLGVSPAGRALSWSCHLHDVTHPSLSQVA